MPVLQKGSISAFSSRHIAKDFHGTTNATVLPEVGILTFFIGRGPAILQVTARCCAAGGEHLGVLGHLGVLEWALSNGYP